MADILIVAATEKELVPFLAERGFVAGESGMLSGHNVLVEITGVGVAAATYNISRFVDESCPDIVIQAGICGAYHGSGLEVGETVLVGSERLADLGVVYEDGFRNVFTEGQALENTAEYSSCGMKNVAGNTVNAACSPLIKPEGASVESMEGYGLFFVCLRKGIKFAELRTVSNMVSTDRSSWNLDMAVRNLASGLTRFIENY